MQPIRNTAVRTKPQFALDPMKLEFGKNFSPNYFCTEYAAGEWKNARIEPLQNLSLHPGAIVFHYGQARPAITSRLLPASAAGCLQELIMPVVNEATALERIGNDKELYQEIVKVFLEDSPEQLRQLKDGLERNDSRLVQRQAHSLKSAAGSIGADGMREVALEMEKGAGKEGAEGVKHLFPKLEACFQQVQEYFNHRRAG